MKFGPLHQFALHAKQDDCAVIVKPEAGTMHLNGAFIVDKNHIPGSGAVDIPVMFLADAGCCVTLPSHTLVAW